MGVTFHTHDAVRVFTSDDPLIHRDKRECKFPRLSDVVHFRPTKLYDGPNKASVDFAFLVESFYNKTWTTADELRFNYGDDYVELNGTRYLKNFKRALEVIRQGKKYGFIGSKNSLAVTTEKACVDVFKECYYAFYEAYLRIKIERYSK